MAERKENRCRWLKVRLRLAEQARLEKAYQKSAFRSLSEYARALLLGRPVTIMHRDASSDALLEELARVRRELNAAGVNLNQAVRRINSARDVPDARLWMNLLTVIRGNLEPAIAQLSEQLNKYAEVWSQKSRVEKA